MLRVHLARERDEGIEERIVPHRREVRAFRLGRDTLGRRDVVRGCVEVSIEAKEIDLGEVKVNFVRLGLLTKLGQIDVIKGCSTLELGAARLVPLRAGMEPLAFSSRDFSMAAVVSATFAASACVCDQGPPVEYCAMARSNVALRCGQSSMKRYPSAMASTHRPASRLVGCSLSRSS